MKQILIDDLQRICDSDLCFDKFYGKSILVTGATGLIGSLTVKALLYCNKKKALNLTVLAMVRNTAKAASVFEEFSEDPALVFVTGDLQADRLDIDHDIDYIVHAAAVTTSKLMVADPVGTIRTQINGTELMLDLAVAKKVTSMVFLSSMEVYGQPSGSGMTKETDLGYVNLANVRSCYPEGKRMSECLCTAYAAQYGLNVKSARLAQTFGAGILPTENRVFAQFARSAMNGTDIVLHTTGESEGNYVYTSDAITGILMLLLKGEAGQAYNIVNEESHTSIRHMAEMVAEEIADGKIRVVIDIPQDSASLGYAPPVKMHLSASKMNALGWKAGIGLKDAYLRMMEWMEEN